MRKDGKLTKREENKVCEGLEVIDVWLRKHMDDQEHPFNYWDVYVAHRELCNVVSAAFADEV